MLLRLILFAMEMCPMYNLQLRYMCKILFCLSEIPIVDCTFMYISDRYICKYAYLMGTHLQMRLYNYTYSTHTEEVSKMNATFTRCFLNLRWFILCNHLCFFSFCFLLQSHPTIYIDKLSQ